MSLRRTLSCFGAAIIVTLSAAPVSIAQNDPAPTASYTVTALDTIGGTYSQGNAINDWGQVAGTAYD
ncbi:MAG: hypothetical protein M3Y37_04460, partial [Chloroflexota bacterium]|nr:hypothetical protein [Chloroflexota bacterium]